MTQEKENKIIEKGSLVQYKLDAGYIFNKIYFIEPSIIQKYFTYGTYPTSLSFSIPSEVFQIILDHNTPSSKKKFFIVLKRVEKEFGKKIGKTFISNKKSFLQLGFFYGGRMYQFWGDEHIFELFDRRSYLEVTFENLKKKI